MAASADSPAGAPRTAALLLDRPILWVAAAALLLMALNPVGYVGGGWDDWYYLDAARCAAEHGFCLPGDHWARRFTLVAPLGWSIALFGETRHTLWLVPAAYSLIALALLVAIAARQFGRAAGLLAGLALLLTPAFGERMLHIGVDIPEAAFALAAVYGLQSAARKGSRGWAAAGGALLALAILTRPTALALLPLFVAATLLHRPLRASLPAFFLGLLTPIALEAGIFAAATGDPLLPWRLSLAHGSIPSTELQSGVDLQQSPLFNVAFIDGWRPAAGIELHWTVDAFLNLLAHPATGLTLIAAFALLLAQRRELGRPEAGGAIIPLLVAGAALYFGALVYALAIDPKPRMFLPVVAVAAVTIGVLASLAWRQGHRLLPVALAALLTANGVAGVFRQPDVKPVVRAARDLLAAEPGPLSIDRSTARLLTLEPLAAALPEYRPGDGRPVLILAQGECTPAELDPNQGWQLVRRIETGAALAGGGSALLCIFAPGADQPQQGQQLEGQ